MNSPPTASDLLSLREDIAATFNNIKTNPMDLNLLMEHLGLLSGSVDLLLQMEAFKLQTAVNAKTSS